MEKIKLFELFCGYGGASFGLQKAGIPFEVVGISEIDKYAVQCYNLNFPNIKNYGDIKKINPLELPDFDLLTGGFPCQDVSIAGKRDLSKGRTNLYQEILRIAQVKKPKFMLLENVKGLLSMEVDEQKLVNIIVRDLQKIGYGVCWKVLNSKDYGIPQNRERIWFVCKFGGWDFMEFQFPNPIELKIFLKDILEKEIDKKYFLDETQVKRLFDRERSFNERFIKGEISSTLCSRDYKDPKVIDLYNHKIKEDICPTLTEPHHNNLRLIEPNPIVFGGLQEHQTPREDGISPSLTSAMGKGGGQTPIILLNEKTRDVEKAINVAQEIADKEQKPVQLDLMHLQSGEIRPLSTYIPQNLDVHRCLQSGEPKEILVEPRAPSRIRDTQKSESFITSWDLRLFGDVSDKEKEVLECWRFNHRLTKYGKLSVGNGMTLKDLQEYFSWNIEDTIKTILEKGYLVLKEDNKLYANSCRKVASMFGGVEFISYPNGWSPTIMANSNINAVFVEPKEPSFKGNRVLNTDGSYSTLVTSMKNNDWIKESSKIRKLTPKECFRLMGFLNDEIKLEGISDSQRYKLAGNGWDSNLVSKIFKRMFK